MAAGRAGANGRRELYRDFETIPPRGSLAALTVPCAVAGWSLALEAAKAHGGRLPLGDLLAHAIRHAVEGYVVTRSQARLTADTLTELKDVPGFAQTFLVDGKPPDAGKTLKQSTLGLNPQSRQPRALGNQWVTNMVKSLTNFRPSQ
jgi:gamma-glutamyltranspeptidase/glutathione hydrolase